MFKMSTNVEYQIFDKAVKAIVKIQHCTGLFDDLYYNRLCMKGSQITPPINYFTGVAVYKEGDTFDIEKAKTIARKKAMRKVYSYFLNFSKEIYYSYHNLMANFEEEIAYLSDKKHDINSEILDLVKD